MASSDESDDEHWKEYRKSAAFRRASFHPPDEIWTIFSESEDCRDVIDYFKALVKVTNIDPTLHGIEFYEVLKSKLTSWKCQSLWDLLNARLKHKEYKNGNVAKDLTCIVIGAGPIGLRTAIELLLLGCRTIIVEKRTEFSRNNVLHLWPFLLTDFRALGAKKFYGKFGAGCIDHINIRTLQSILLKLVLILGGEVHIGVAFKHMVEPKDLSTGWRAALEPENLSISKIPFNVVIGADGKKNVLPGFPQIELRGALAIGITCNFVNNNTIEEARVAEISGVSYQFNPTFFKDMDAQYGVKLENIVYYKNETHYFVMTALKASLLKLGVIIKEQSDPKLLLENSNIDKDKLIDFTLSAVNFATDHQLPPLEFKKLSNGKPDIALFDFTSIKKAANASRIIERKKQKLLLALVGDSLMEPFWPTGSGAGRGVLSALDVAWMIRQFALKNPPLSILRERENVFKLLSGTTNDSLQKSHKDFTIDPKTRYKTLDTKRVSNMTSLKGLYDTDDLAGADFSVVSPMTSAEATPVKKQLARRRSSSGKKVTSTHLHPHGVGITKHRRKSDKDKQKEQPVTVGNTKAFWEEHNKKNTEEKVREHVPKKVSSNSFGDLELSIDELSELEDDVIEQEPSHKKGFKTSQKLSVKRQVSVDDLKPSATTNDSVKRKYQAKGGGLKSKRDSTKKTPEKQQEDKKSRRRSLSTKRNRKKSSRSDADEKEKEVNETISFASQLVNNETTPRAVDPRNFFRKWVETLTKKSTVSADNTPDDAINRCTQTAALGVLAIPLLMNCNRPPPRRTTDIKIKDINKAKDVFLNPSIGETKEISVKRAGSVKHTVAKYKMLQQKDDQNDNYYDFIRRSSLKDSKNKDQVDAINLTVNSDFEPKEVIDVEKALIAQDEEEERRTRLSKSSTWSGTTTENTLELQLALEEFCDLQTPLNSVYMLQVLFNVHKRIMDAPMVDKYYRIYVKGNIFERYVWLLDGSEHFMAFSGWVRCGNYLVLSKSFQVQSSLRVIEDVLKKKKKAQIMYSGSMQRQPRRQQDINVRRSKSNVGNMKINEDEVLASYANIDSPTQLHESDSAFGSGIDDDDEQIEHRKLRRVESRERVVGNEQYVVVDFVGSVEVKSTRKLSKNDDESPESALSVSPSYSMNSTFDEISASDVPYYNNVPSEGVHDRKSAELKKQKEENIEAQNIKKQKNDAEISQAKIISVEKYTEEDQSNQIKVKNNKENNIKNDEESVKTIPAKSKLPPLDNLKNTDNSPDLSDKNKTLQNTTPKTAEVVRSVSDTQTDSKPKYRAKSGGLKKAKQEIEISTLTLEKEKEVNQLLNKTSEINNRSKTNATKRTDSNNSDIPEIRNRYKRSDSSISNSSTSSMTSIKSITSETSVKSIVMQNKLLFDKQIADESKRKYGSTSNLDTRPKKLSVDTSMFELKNNKLRHSFNDNSKRTSLQANTDELNITGIVSGNKGLYEGKTKSASVTGLSYRQNRNSAVFDDKMSDPSIESLDKKKSEPAIDLTLTTDANVAVPNISTSVAEIPKQESETVKKKKKGVFRKKKKHTEENKLKADDAIHEVKEESEVSKKDIIDHHDEEKKKKGLFSRIKKRSKSYDIEEKKRSAERLNSSEIEISAESESVPKDVFVSDVNTSLEVSTETSNLNVIDHELNNDNIDDTVNNISNNNTTDDVTKENVNVNNIDTDDIDLDKVVTNVVENELNEASNIRADLQAIVNRQSSLTESDNKKKKRIFKKKKRNSDVNNSNIMSVNGSLASSPEVVETNTDIAMDIKLNVESDVSNTNPTSDVSNMEPSLEEVSTELPKESLNTTAKLESNIENDKLFESPIAKSNDDSVAISDLSIKTDVTAEISVAIGNVNTNHIDINSKLLDENESNIKEEKHDMEIDIKKNSIGELVFQRSDSTVSDASLNKPALVLPQISVIEPEEDGISVAESDDDDLVHALEQASGHTNEDTHSLDQIDAGSGTPTLKKKKKFPSFHIKSSSSKKEKKEKKEKEKEALRLSSNNLLQGNERQSSLKGSKKNKRHKSLENSNPDLTNSIEDLSSEHHDTEKSKKKNPLNIFRSKKKKNESSDKNNSIKGTSFISYSSDHEDSKSQTFMSSDEFRIPETPTEIGTENVFPEDHNGISSSGSLSSKDRKGRGSSSSEYSKKKELIEIAKPEPMEF